MRHTVFLLLVVVAITLPTLYCHAGEVESDGSTPDIDLKAERVGGKTDDNVAEREAQAINSEGFSKAELKLLQEAGDQFEFQAEVNRLMSLIINSIYSNKEIFLRELISNASDALDKIRFASLTDPEALAAKAELEIRIKPDPENKQLHIIDTGVGMTKANLVDNLGTIAQSGTKEFLDKLQQSQQADSNLIGQFGVGFYSSFLVADTVTVTSKNNSDDQYVWTSGADSNFIVSKDPRGNTLARGTIVTLHLKDDMLEYLDSQRLRTLVSKYSEFINFPIYLWESHIEEREVPVEEEEEDDTEVDAEEEEDKMQVEDEEEEDADVEEDDMEDFELVEETVWEWVLLNDTQPLWTRDPKEVSDNDYQKFYKVITKDIDNPLTWTHFKAEGDLEFRAVLFIPEDPPQNAFETGKESSRGMKLYVKRVFITDNFDVVIPKYLSFVRGVIDSDSLQLNVSREVLQQDKSLKLMEKKLIRKVIAMVQQLAEDDDRYSDFYDDYRIFLKLGVVDDEPNRSRLAKLLRYPSTKTEGESVSLETYVSRMPESQDSIYFIAGESAEILEKSPLLERLNAKGYEVLYFTDPLDEYVGQVLKEFEGKPLVNIAKEGLKLDDEEETEEDEKELEKEYKPLTEWLKKALKQFISKAVVTNRLTKSPSALVSSGYGYTANMQRILKAQALTHSTQSQMQPKKVMEINPKHPIIAELNRRVTADEDDSVAKEIAEVMYDTAALNSGFPIDDPAAFAKRINNMMKLSLNLDIEVDIEEEAESPVDDAPVEDAPAAEDAPVDDEPVEAASAHDEL